MQRVDFSLADMQAAAARVAKSAETTLVAERAVLTDEIAFAVANKQALGGGHWQATYIAEQKARAARAVADAIAEICAEVSP